MARRTYCAAAPAPTVTKRGEIDWSDPYQPLVSPMAPDLADRLRQLRVLDGLDNEDASSVVGAIINAVMDCGLADRSAATAMQQKAANVGAGCDLQRWHDRGKVSAALGTVAVALQPQAQAATGTADRPKKTPSRTRAAPKAGPSGGGKAEATQRTA
jgi:hypothetical protein